MEVGPTHTWKPQAGMLEESTVDNPVLLPGLGVRQPNLSPASFSLAELINKRVWRELECLQSSD